jgi:hypothetical protein
MENIFVLAVERKLIIKEAFVNFVATKFNNKFMNALQEISSHPEYASKASAFSKLIIGAFFVSYVYMILTTSSKTGFIELAIFLFVGLFVSSIAIAMPFFILKRIFQKISVLIVITSILVTFFITKFVFDWAFNEPKATNATISILPDEFSDDKTMFEESLFL